MRLFLICLAWLAIAFPLEVYVIYNSSQSRHVPYSWAETHDATQWKTVPLMYSYGEVLYIRYVWLVCGFLVFLAFGLGKDAVKMYKQTLLNLGFGRCLPSLREGSSPRSGSVAATLSSINSKAKLIFSWKGSPTSSADRTWATDSQLSKATISSSDDPISPKTTTFLEAIHEGPSGIADAEKGIVILQPTRFQRLTTAFSPSKKRPIAAGCRHGESMDLDVLVNKEFTVSSTVSAGERSSSLPPAGTHGYEEVYVQREVRQGSEAALR